MRFAVVARCADPRPVALNLGGGSERSFPPPTLCECLHGLLARRLIAVRGRPAFVVREDHRPHPGRSHGRGVGLESGGPYAAGAES
jgi:hypothetical protein